jgi:serine/threonine protein kinase
VAALEEYHQLLRSGLRPSRADFLGRHQAIAGDLAERLDDIEFVQGAAGQLFLTGCDRGTDDEPIRSGRLGEYRIIREIGRGGMGVVYEVEQTPLGRRVALKVLPSTASLDARQLQRFRVEAQAAASLHHEHIVPVHGVGCDRGVHYYAMQFIDGRSLAEVIRELRPTPSEEGEEAGASKPDGTASSDAGSAPRSNGSSAFSREHCRAAARFGRQTALALEHAHDLGVIHRDIKPSNLLVDRRDHLWVTDFGLARLPQGENDLTRTGDVIGTVRYMSPEQVRGKREGVDARTDIYGLGVTIYELLTMRPAFDGRDRQELMRRILHDEPVAPRRINSSIPRDLETIVLKAIEKEPAARYSSARELAKDLQRFLEDQPIRARRPSLVDRSLKWARRHRAIVIAATTALLVTLATTTAVLWLAKNQTDVTLAKLRDARTAHEASIRFSLSALDRITRSVAGQPGGGSRPDQAAARVLPVAVEYFDRVIKTFDKDDRLGESVAEAHRQAGFCRMSLGDAEGRRDYRLAIHSYQELAARFPDRIWYSTHLIDTLHEYAGLLTAPEDGADSNATMRRALAVAAGVIRNENARKSCYNMSRMGLVGALNGLVRDVVKHPVARPNDAALAVRLARWVTDREPEWANAWHTLGAACYRAGDWPAALIAAQRSTELGKGGDALDWLLLAAIQQRNGDREEARRWYDRAVAWVQQNPGEHVGRAGELRRFQDEAANVLGEP